MYFIKHFDNLLFQRLSHSWVFKIFLNQITQRRTSMYCGRAKIPQDQLRKYL